MNILFRILPVLVFLLFIPHKLSAQKDFEYYRKVMNRAFDNKRYDDAIVAVYKLIEIKPDYTNAYSFGAVAYRYINIFPEAISFFKKAVELSPSVRTYGNLAIVYSELGYDSLSLNLYEKIIEIDPDYFFAYSNRGATYLQLYKLGEAMADIGTAIKLDSLSPHPYMNLGNLNRLQENYEDAIRYYNKVLELDAAFANALYCLGQVLDKQGKKKEAEEAFRKVIPMYSMKIKENHYDYSSLLNRAKTYAKLGEDKLASEDFKKALQMYNEIVVQNPDSWTMIGSRAECYFGLKDYDNARLDFEKVLSMRPEQRGAKERLTEIEQAP